MAHLKRVESVQALPLEAHVWLAEQCLRQERLGLQPLRRCEEMRGKEAMKAGHLAVWRLCQDCFAFLERSLALRLRPGLGSP